MKKIFPTLFLILMLPIVAFSQSYTFEVSQGTYTDLVDPISITNGLTWDDPEWVIPIGFDFQLFETTMDTLFTDAAAVFYSSREEQGTRAFMTNYGLDLADRGYDTDDDEGLPGGISPISYQISGNVGSRIFKMEWKNAGFYEAIDENGMNSMDFTNLQMWLFEGSNTIEFHYGSNSLVETMNLYNNYEYDFGILVALDPFFTQDFDFSSEAVGLSGEPTTPVFGNVTEYNEDAINAPIPDGTIYRFTKSTSTATNDLIRESNLIQILPNPVTETFQIKKSITDLQIQTIQILHANGQVIKTLGDTPAVNISDLSAGCYFVQFLTDQGTLTKRIIKM